MGIQKLKISHFAKHFLAIYTNYNNTYTQILPHFKGEWNKNTNNKKTFEMQTYRSQKKGHKLNVNAYISSVQLPFFDVCLCFIVILFFFTVSSRRLLLMCCIHKVWLPSVAFTFVDAAEQNTLDSGKRSTWKIVSNREKLFGLSWHKQTNRKRKKLPSDLHSTFGFRWTAGRCVMDHRSFAKSHLNEVCLGEIKMRFNLEWNYLQKLSERKNGAERKLSKNEQNTNGTFKWKIMFSLFHWMAVAAAAIINMVKPATKKENNNGNKISSCLYR